ncbi:AsmA family protein [Ralstonia sp. UBA689]|uniref:AsmA family protein n=1 Tax=Ralstonia sp. UBA689 TaxID=1947373 RepID=UPI0025D8FCDB|nr:AsmA family protein [Ralstonia sp. UBA689]
MRTSGKLALGLVITPVVIVAAAVIFVLTFDWSHAKPYLNDHVSQAIGRPFAINGDLVLTWKKPEGESGWRAYVPWPRLIANDITIGNPDWTKQPHVATVHQLTFVLEALPLLAHRIVIPSVTLDTPTIALERDKQNRNNWTFDLAGGDKQPSNWKLELREIAFSKGSLALDDDIKRIHLAATIDTVDNQALYTAANGTTIKGDEQPPVVPTALAAAASGAVAKTPVAPDPQQPYGIAWTVKGTYNNAAINGSGKAGGVLRLQDARRPYPLQADVTIGKTRIDLAGTLTNPASLTALDLRLHLSGASMAHLYPLTGVVLPDTPPFDTRGRLIGELRKQGSNWRYEKFTGRVGGSDLGGTLTFAMREPRPQLSGELVSHQLLFADLAPIIGADSNASKAKRNEPGDEAVHQPADKVLPIEPFRTDRWNAIDADVKFTGERIVHSADLPIDHLVTHVKLQDAVLTLDPLNFGVAGGALTSNIQLDGNATPMQARAALAARRFHIKQLFPKIESMQASVGTINGDAQLSATGNSVAALLGSSNGEIKVLVEQGTISKFILEAMGLNVGNVILTKLFGDKQVTINCAAGDFAVSDGLARARTFLVDTQDAVIDVTGATSFKQEALDFTIHPDSKGLRVFSLRTPLYVKGTYKHPDVSINPAVVALRAGGAVALAFAAPVAAVLPVLELKPAPDSTCGKLLADVRQRPTAPPPGKTYRNGKPSQVSAADAKTSATTVAPPARDPHTSGG